MTSLTARVAAVRSWLTSQQMLTDEDWLNGCIEYLCSEDAEYTQQDINRLAREQWLLNDLKDICPGSLPPGLLARDKTQLSGRYVLQVNCAFDVGTPAYQQYQKLKKVNVENIEETTRHEERIPNHRMIKLYLTDGVQEIYGMEYRTMRNLTCDITPGCKLLLKGPVECRRGMLLLQEQHVEILGGEVEDLVAANDLPAVLSRMLGVQNVANQNNAVLPAPSAVVPTNSDRTPTPTAHGSASSAAVPTNSDRTPTPTAHGSASSAAVPTISDRTATPTAHDAINRNVNNCNLNAQAHSSERPAHSRPLFNTVDRPASFDRPANSDRSTLQSNVSSIRPVAVVTGVPIMDNFCDDDIDLEQIAAIEEQAIKSNKRPLLSGDRTERRNSAEKRLKTLNARNESREDEFPSDDDFLDDVDYFKTADLNNIAVDRMNAKPRYPINVQAEPFVYIKQINDMDQNALEGRVFRIKGQILKLLSKLSIGKEGWSLKCTVIDGTGCLDVDFTSDVMTKLVGYSPVQMTKMKKEMATKPDVKEIAMTALNAAKVHLQVLNCIIEITFVEGPKITELSEFTQRHAEMLKNRLAPTNL